VTGIQFLVWTERCIAELLVLKVVKFQTVASCDMKLNCVVNTCQSLEENNAPFFSVEMPITLSMDAVCFHKLLVALSRLYGVIKKHVI
jgi:hypothetical protein